MHMLKGFQLGSQSDTLFHDPDCDLDCDPPLQWDWLLGNHDQVFRWPMQSRIGNMICLVNSFFALCNCGAWPSGLYSLRQVTEVKLGGVRSDSGWVTSEA